METRSNHIQLPGHPDASGWRPLTPALSLKGRGGRAFEHALRGFSAVEVAIFMVAALVIATVSAIAMLDLGNSAAEKGKTALGNGLQEVTGALALRGPVIAVRGDVDVDGNGTIDLSGADRQAVVKLQLTLTLDTGDRVDLTPPYTVDDTAVDPDVSSAAARTIISVTTGSFSAARAAWTVTFPGTDDGDFHLDRGERAEVTVWLHPFDGDDGVYILGSGPTDPFVDSAAELLAGRGHVTIRISPPQGPPVTVARVLPIELTPTLLLE